MSMTSERFIVNAQGKKTAVILPIWRYELLRERCKALRLDNGRRNGKNKRTARVKKSELKKLLFQLSQRDLIELFEELESRIETFEMMRMAESAFGEWLEPGEDIYEEK